MAQPCLPEGIWFSTQTQIDSFQIIYPGCTEIDGDVRIQGDDIKNLYGLNVLTSIGGDLIIRDNDSLVSLSGLEGVLSISSDFSILGSNALINLSGLDNLTSIGGNLKIGDYFFPSGNQSLTSLVGLNNLVSVGGNLTIQYNPALLNLNGLENIEEITYNLIISDNLSLNSLIGIGDIDSIGGLTIFSNPFLIDLNDLESLIYINEDIMINSSSLSSLEGLNNIEYIGGNLDIIYNDLLQDITALSKVTSVGGNLYVISNSALNSLSGLQNINASSILNLYIYNNSSLSTCAIQSICDYLANPNGYVKIYDNVTGCNSPGEIAGTCGFAMDCLPYGHYYFVNQSNIDSFPAYYPGCTELKGNTIIQGSSITNLNGLSSVISIGNNLTISTDSLKNLVGLGNLENIGEDFLIKDNYALDSLVDIYGLTDVGKNLTISNNTSLTNLWGLNNLYSIGGKMLIQDNPRLESILALYGLTSIDGDLVIDNNDSLNSLLGLKNVNSINGRLVIGDNDVLTSLSGLDNISSSSIEHLHVYDNDSLSKCNVLSICEYLSFYPGPVWIYSNKSGCNSPDQVFDSCNWVFIDDPRLYQYVIVSPNPFTTSTTFSFALADPSAAYIKIFNSQGQLVDEMRLEGSYGPHTVKWDAGGQPAGIYYYRIQAGEMVGGGKLMKME